MTTKKIESKLKSPRITLIYYYGVSIISVTIGITAVVLLNLFTPLQIIQNAVMGGDNSVPLKDVLGLFLPRLFLVVVLAYGIVALGLRQLLKPIARCLSMEKEGHKPDNNQVHEARIRLLNLHFLFARMNILLWIVFSGLAGAAAVIAGILDFQTATIFAARGSMVGVIASSIATLRIEIVSRKVLIPHFFPAGDLSQIEGARQWSIGKRMLLGNRLVAFIPFIILLITLITLQWQLENHTVTAVEFGRELIIFTIVLAVWVALFSKQLSLLQNRNIVEPINDLVSRLRGIEKGQYDEKIQVTSRDEIGYAGEVVNAMAEDLKERLLLQRSLDLARQVQQNLLPKNNPILEGLDIAGMSSYCDETGGDYYDFIQSSNMGRNKIGIVIGDVSGHGISSALLMATTRGFLRQRFALQGSLAQIVTDVNVQLARDVGDSGNFMTMFFLTIDTQNMCLEWIRAGHDPAIIYDSNTEKVSELKGKGIALGVDQEYHFEENEKLHLRRGQIILLGTDGIWEARNRAGVMYGKNSVYKILKAHSHRNASEILDEITQSLAEYQKNVSAEDDITCVIIKAASLSS